MLVPTEVDAKSHTASFRISVPLAKLPSGRYTVQAVAIAAGTQLSAFGRAYLALQDAPAASAGAQCWSWSGRFCSRFAADPVDEPPHEFIAFRDAEEFSQNNSIAK